MKLWSWWRLDWNEHLCYSVRVSTIVCHTIHSLSKYSICSVSLGNHGVSTMICPALDFWFKFLNLESYSAATFFVISSSVVFLHLFWLDERKTQQLYPPSLPIWSSKEDLISVPDSSRWITFFPVRSSRRTTQNHKHHLCQSIDMFVAIQGLRNHKTLPPM